MAQFLLVGISGQRFVPFKFRQDVKTFCAYLKIVDLWTFQVRTLAQISALYPTQATLFFLFEVNAQQGVFPNIQGCG